MSVCVFQSDKIYTVIKTSPMWRDVLGQREAVFKVNQKAHELSLLTMVGPSPDWCIGEWHALKLSKLVPSIAPKMTSVFNWFSLNSLEVKSLCISTTDMIRHALA